MFAIAHKQTKTVGYKNHHISRHSSIYFQRQNVGLKFRSVNLGGTEDVVDTLFYYPTQGTRGFFSRGGRKYFDSLHERQSREKKPLNENRPAGPIPLSASLPDKHVHEIHRCFNSFMSHSIRAFGRQIIIAIGLFG